VTDVVLEDAVVGDLVDGVLDRATDLVELASRRESCDACPQRALGRIRSL
jgi:hypothetical protein